MKKTEFTEEQVLFAIGQENAVQPTANVSRRMGLGEATYNEWTKKHVDMRILEV